MRHLHRSLLHMAMLPVLALAGTAISAQDPAADDAPDSAPAWHNALVRIESERLMHPTTGLVMQVNDRTAKVLTLLECRANTDPHAWLVRSKADVSLTTKDGVPKKLSGVVREIRFSSSIVTRNDMNSYLAVVEIPHDQLKLTSLNLSTAAPQKGDAAHAVMNSWDDESDAPYVPDVTVANSLDPAKSPTRIGEITGSDWAQDGLLAVLDTNGNLTGIAQARVSAGGVGGGFGGGFGGGSGGGFYSVPDPRARVGFGSGLEAADGGGGAGQMLPPLTFVAVVDYASELQQLGLDVPKGLLELQEQRQRIHRDSFGRPIRSKNLQVTWSDDHTELHGFSNVRGEWAKLPIEEHEVIIPIVSDNVAAVSLSEKIAAYSGVKGVWDVLTLPSGAHAPPSVSGDVVTARHGKHYYTFAASSGVWTSPTDPSYQKHEEAVVFNGDIGELERILREAGCGAHVQDSGVRGKILVSGIRHHVEEALQMIDRLRSGNHNGDSLLRGENASDALSLLQEREAKLTESFGASHPETKRVREQVESMIQSAPNALALLLVREARLSKSHGSSHPTMVKIRKQIESLIENRRTGTTKRLPGLGQPTASNKASLALAEQARAAGGKDAATKERLRGLVSKAFEERLAQQKNVATRLENQLREVRKAIEARESNRERIIERRVEELLNPNVEWSSIVPNAADRVPRDPGIPAVGTQIGLPGPPHLPPGGLGVGQLASPPGTNAADVPTSSAIVEDLNERRRFAVPLSADRLHDAQEGLKYWQRPLEEIRKDKQDNQISAEDVATNIKSISKDIEGRQEEFRDWMSRWKNSWRIYESALRRAELNVDDAVSRFELAKLKLERKTSDSDLVSDVELETQRVNLALAKTQLSRAEQELNELQKIAEDSPQLNPNEFDTDALLADPRKEIPVPASSAGRK